MSEDVKDAIKRMLEPHVIYISDPHDCETEEAQVVDLEDFLKLKRGFEKLMEQRNGYRELHPLHFTETLPELIQMDDAEIAADDVKHFKAQTGGGPPWDPETALCVLASDHDRVVAELRRQEELWRASFKDCARMVTDRDETIAALRAEIAETAQFVIAQDARLATAREVNAKLWWRYEEARLTKVFVSNKTLNAEIAVIERKDGTNV